MQEMSSRCSLWTLPTTLTGRMESRKALWFEFSLLFLFFNILQIGGGFSKEQWIEGVSKSLNDARSRYAIVKEDFTAVQERYEKIQAEKNQQKKQFMETEEQARAMEQEFRVIREELFNCSAKSCAKREQVKNLKQKGKALMEVAYHCNAMMSRLLPEGEKHNTLQQYYDQVLLPFHASFFFHFLPNEGGGGVVSSAEWG